MDSKEYSWKWVTQDEILSKGPCEFLYLHLIPSSAATSTATLYDGQDTNGKIITDIRIATSRACELEPPVPVYCAQGLFIDMKATIKGAFIQWRELGKKG